MTSLLNLYLDSDMCGHLFVSEISSTFPIKSEKTWWNYDDREENMFIRFFSNEVRPNGKNVVVIPGRLKGLRPPVVNIPEAERTILVVLKYRFSNSKLFQDRLFVFRNLLRVSLRTFDVDPWLSLSYLLETPFVLTTSLIESLWRSYWRMTVCTTTSWCCAPCSMSSWTRDPSSMMNEAAEILFSMILQSTSMEDWLDFRNVLRDDLLTASSWLIGTWRMLSDSASRPRTDLLTLDLLSARLISFGMHRWCPMILIAIVSSHIIFESRNEE